MDATDSLLKKDWESYELTSPKEQDPKCNGKGEFPQQGTPESKCFKTFRVLKKIRDAKVSKSIFCHLAALGPFWVMKRAFRVFTGPARVAILRKSAWR